MIAHHAITIQVQNKKTRKYANSASTWTLFDAERFDGLRSTHRSPPNQSPFYLYVISISTIIIILFVESRRMALLSNSNSCKIVHDNNFHRHDNLSCRRRGVRRKSHKKNLARTQIFHRITQHAGIRGAKRNIWVSTLKVLRGMLSSGGSDQLWVVFFLSFGKDCDAYTINWNVNAVSTPRVWGILCAPKKEDSAL